MAPQQPIHPAYNQGERTSATGLFNFGDSYLAAAHVLLKAEVECTFPDRPVRFLIYHAAELHLKAFLRASGLTVAEVRKLGHSFSKLISTARSQGLRIDDVCESAFVFGEDTGDVMDSRYIRTGYRTWIETKDLGHCAAQIRRTVRLHPKRTGSFMIRGENAGEVDDGWERAWDVV